MRLLLLYATIVPSFVVAGITILQRSATEVSPIQHFDQSPSAAFAKHQFSRALSKRSRSGSLSGLQALRSDTIPSDDRRTSLDAASRLIRRGQCMGKLPCADRSKSKPSPQPPVPRASMNDVLHGPPESSIGTISTFGTPPGTPSRTPAQTPPRQPIRNRLITSDAIHGPTMSPAGRPGSIDTPPRSSMPSPSTIKSSPASRTPSFYRSVTGKWTESPESTLVRLGHTMPSPSRNSALSSFPATTSSNSDFMADYHALQPPSSAAESESVAMQRTHAALAKHYAIVSKQKNPTTLDEMAKQTRWMEKQNSHSLASEFYAQQARSRRNSFARRR